MFGSSCTLYELLAWSEEPLPPLREWSLWAAELSAPARGTKRLELSDFRAIRVSWFLRPSYYESAGSLAGWRYRAMQFRSVAQILLRAVEQRDLKAAQNALRRLPETCSACHLDYH